MHTSHTIPLPNRAPLILGQTPLVMGILNVTPDSFSDGGQHNLVASAVAHARQMLADGADIIDIGGESTRPGSEPVGVQQELDRVMPVIDALIAAGITAPISVDTYKPLVADQALQAGASIINDVHGLQGAPEMAEVAALHNAAVIAMHWDKARDTAVPILEAMASYFARSIALATAAGLSTDRLILDPGFGFGKTLAENYEILKKTASIPQACCQTMLPMLIGTSRKSMIGKLLENQPEDRLAGTLATTVLGYSNGGHIFRVHDVRANRDALRVAQATLYGPPAELR
ncbi:dihydropteroate synthase [Devosia sp. A369]